MTQNYANNTKINNNVQKNNNFNDFKPSNSHNIFTPYNINTDKFGELWENFPDEDELNLYSNINNAQQYHEIIKSRGNFAAVDIINNEAISAAYYKNQITLVHASIENNQINFLVKCQNNLFNKEIIDLIRKLFN